MKTANWLTVCFVIISTAVCSAAQRKNDSTKSDNLIEQNIVTAQNLLKTGDAAAAVGILQTALQSSPQNVKVKFWLGKAFYSQGNYRKTIENLSGIADKFPKNSSEQIQIVQMLGLSHYVLGQLAEAIPYFEKITQRQPENGEVSYALGVSYIQTRQPAKSRETFAGLFKVPTNSALAYLLNAKMHVRQQFEETAEIELNKALELDPKIPEVRFVLGELAIYRAEIDKGIELLKQEITLNPANAMAYYRLGEGLSRQLKWDEAIPPLQKSIWLNPFFSGPYIVLGKVYLKKQDLGNAENLLRRSTQIDPNNFGAHYLLGQVLQQAGKTEEAKAEFALAEKLRGSGEKEP
ncbi:MAG: tetratricopeptide repeat protein [Pyrinomonadaceae bacterium]|nr:tetratricopeptide repeat protein [Pyrinomonadaceae bacterium]